MYAIEWDKIGEHFYEAGVDHGVLYPAATDGTYPTGVAWNGLTSVSESPSGADANKQWADNINYLTLYGAEEFGATVEAFTYPDEFAECDGSASLVTGVQIGQQPRRGFGLSYRTKVGNDTVGQDLAFKLHLIYGCRASPSDRGYETLNDSPEPITFSWEITTTPVEVPGLKPTACITIDSTKVDSDKLTDLEEILYGTAPTYTKFTGSTFVSGTDYYELNAAGYEKTTDTEPQDGKTYYTQTAAGTEAMLPLPAKIAEIFAEG